MMTADAQHVRVHVVKLSPLTDRAHPPIRGPRIEPSTVTSPQDRPDHPLPDRQVEGAGGVRHQWRGGGAGCPCRRCVACDARARSRDPRCWSRTLRSPVTRSTPTTRPTRRAPARSAPPCTRRRPAHRGPFHVGHRRCERTGSSHTSSTVADRPSTRPDHDRPSTPGTARCAPASRQAAERSPSWPTGRTESVQHAAEHRPDFNTSEACSHTGLVNPQVRRHPRAVPHQPAQRLRHARRRHPRPPRHRPRRRRSRGRDPRASRSEATPAMGPAGRLPTLGPSHRPRCVFTGRARPGGCQHIAAVAAPRQPVWTPVADTTARRCPRSLRTRRHVRSGSMRHVR